MIHGYMPYGGNINEDLHVPRGQLLAGHAIGILCLDNNWYPMPPGNVANASTFNFPVLYRIVLGMREWKEDRFSPKILNKLVEGAKELEAQGVRAISGACGFFAHFQRGVAAAVNVPVFLSSLCQIPLIRQGLKPGQKIGIITAASDVMSPRTFSEIGISDTSDLAIIGTQDYGELHLMRTSNNVGHLNHFKIEQDIVKLAKEFVASNPEIGVILLECADFPAYAWAVQNAVDLPVFDFYTLIEWIYNSVVRHPFAGFY